jgi:hypothetical protein
VNSIQIIDYSFQEVPIGSTLLPIMLMQGQEILLTSIFLQITAINNKIELRGTVGWEGQLLIVAELPKLVYRLRLLSSSGPIVYQTTDSAFLGMPPDQGPLIPLDFTSTFVHTQAPDPSMVGTFQQFFLTVQHTGFGNATIVGPINLTGMVVG